MLVLPRLGVTILRGSVRVARAQADLCARLQALVRTSGRGALQLLRDHARSRRRLRALNSYLPVNQSDPISNRFNILYLFTNLRSARSGLDTTRPGF